MLSLVISLSQVPEVCSIYSGVSFAYHATLSILMIKTCMKILFLLYASMYLTNPFIFLTTLYQHNRTRATTINIFITTTVTTTRQET